MSKKLRIHNTDTDNLISNLRGEIGEIIYTWLLLKNLLAQLPNLEGEELIRVLEDPQVIMLNSLIEKMQDELISRLAELGEEKVGRLTFYFATKKLGNLEEESNEFSKFVDKKKFKRKRNYDISHKELPEKWTDQQVINISYETIICGIVRSLRLMKKIDEEFLGPRAKYYWREMRNRRYKATFPAKIGYMLMPYIKLPAEVRKSIIIEEIKEGFDVWKDMEVEVNGEERTIKTYGEMGAIKINGSMMIVDPFTDLNSITFPTIKDETNSNSIGT